VKAGKTKPNLRESPVGFGQHTGAATIEEVSTMKRTLGVLTTLLVLGLAANASAYDFLYTGDTAATHDAGAFGVKANVVFLSATSYFDMDGKKQDLLYNGKRTETAVPVDIYYSITDRVEIGVQPKFRMLKAEADAHGLFPALDEQGSGIGDTWVKAKFMLMPEPIVAARLGVKIATGDNQPEGDDIATGDGQMDLDGALLLGMPAGSGTFDAAIGYRMRMENDDKYAPGSEIHFMAGYTYNLNEATNLGIAGDGYFGSDAKLDGEALDESGTSAVWINPSIDYTLENGLQLGAGYHYPLMGKSVYALSGVSAFIGWGW
jgi:hypothetical protein